MELIYVLFQQMLGHEKYKLQQKFIYAWYRSPFSRGDMNNFIQEKVIKILTLLLNIV